MVRQIRFFTDSTVDLTQELVAQLDLAILPLHVRLKEQEFLDGVDITTDALYRFARENKTLPKTAAVTPESFYEAFKKALDEGNDVVYTGISGELSSTFQSACMAKEMLLQEGIAPDRIQMVNSFQLSTGIALLLMKGKEKALEGASAEECARYMQDVAGRISTSFVLDTLEFMKMGGRCSNVTYLATSVLRIHPQISVQEGKLVVTDKFRGNIDSCYRQYFKKQVQAHLDEIEPDRIFVTTTCSKEVTLALAKEVEELNYFKNVYTTFAGSTIASHCGPNCMGYLFVKKA